MINADAPTIPNSDIEITNQQPSIADSFVIKAITTFARPWYRFFNDIKNFLTALRNAPQQVQQADLSKFTAKLGREQVGVQVWVPSPYNHLLRWDGTEWQFAPGDGGSGFTSAFFSAPTADGWQLCDGSTVTLLRGDGSVADQALPTTAGLYFRR